MESHLALYLFGSPRIERYGEPLQVARRKAFALVAYLAVTGESHRRDALVNLLWPEYDSSRGRAALRRTLFDLRKALDGDWLIVDRDQIGLNPDAKLWVDVDQFRQHLAETQGHNHPATQVCAECVASLAAAVELARGEFLSGFSLKDSYNFDDWQLFQAEELRRELAEALEGLVRWHSSQREFDTAIAYARRWLAQDPLEEAAHRHLMRLYAWSGQRPAALRQYEVCAAQLREQLGVPPGNETSELFHIVQEGRPPPLPTEGKEWQAQDFPAPLPEFDIEIPAFLKEVQSVESPLFVARQGELHALDRHLQTALSGQGRMVFVTGDAGSGKTALLQEFSRRAQETHPNLVVAGGFCNAHTGVGDPYLPFREILGLLTGDVEAQWSAGAMTQEQARRLWELLPLTTKALVKAGPDLIETIISSRSLLARATSHTPSGARWLAELDSLVARKAASLASPSLQQSDLFEQYTRVLKTLARQAPLVLMLDDLQWADRGSINLLFHLGRCLAGSQILVLCAYRREEVSIGRDGQRHPLAQVVSEVQRLFGDIMVDVDQAERQAFLDAFLDHEPNRLETEFRDMLLRQTRGHPLFTIELLRGMQERGDLVQDEEGRWIAGASLNWEDLPARVEAVVAERIARLSQPLREALRIASVEGQDFTAEVVARVQGIDERELLGRLSRELDKRHRLVRAQSIQRVDGQRLSRYRFRHILFRTYLYGGLDEVERVYLHEQVGTAMEDLHGVEEGTAMVPDIAPQLAHHFQEAQIDDKAIVYLCRAGERALQLSAYAEALAHLNTGLALLTAQPSTSDPALRWKRTEQELELQLALGMASIGTQARTAPAARAYIRARELSQQLGKTSELCQAMSQLAMHYYTLGEHQRAREFGKEALRLAQQTGNPLLVAVGHSILGFIFFALGDYIQSRTHCGETISFYDPDQHHQGFITLRSSDLGLTALSYDACCLWCLGYPDQALDRSRQALDKAQELDHPFSLADTLAFAGCLHSYLRGDAADQKEHATALMRVSQNNVPGWTGTGTRHFGMALVLSGHVEEGITLIREGLALDQALNVRCHLPQTLGSLAWAEAQLGDSEQAMATLSKAITLMNETSECIWKSDLYRVRADLQLRLGDERQAEASYQLAIEAARRQGAKSWELRATIGLARQWMAQGKRDEARRALEAIYGWFTEGFDTRDLEDAAALLEALS